MRPIKLFAAATVLACSFLNAAKAEPWKGFYAGAGYESLASGEETGLSAIFGYNKLLAEKYVVSGEVSYFTDTSGKFQSYFISKRGGILINPATLFYLTGGIGSYSDGDSAMRAGAGLEWARSERFSIRLEAAVEQCCNNPIMDGYGAVRAMAVWHF